MGIRRVLLKDQDCMVRVTVREKGTVWVRSMASKSSYVSLGTVYYPYRNHRRKASARQRDGVSPQLTVTLTLTPTHPTQTLGMT